jgi:hypothetical protein
MTEANITPIMGDFKMPNYVFVIDTKKQPLNPIHPGRARKLLNSGKAAVWRTYPLYDHTQKTNYFSFRCP